MSNKLPYVLTDLDGTVVSGEDGKISYETAVDIVEYQKESNHRLTIATGRGDIMCKEIIDILKIKNPVISYNGALIRDPKHWRVLDVTYLDPKLCYDIIMEAYKKGLDIVAYDVDAIVVTPVSKRYKVWKNMNKIAVDDKYKVDFVMYHDVREMAVAAREGMFKAVKLLIDCDEDCNMKDAFDLFNIFSKDIEIAASGEGLVDCMPKGVSKKSGLIKYAEMMKIDPKEVVFFGDNHNDLQIMEYVNTGYAVGNAVEPLKKLATEVIDPVNKNGIGKQLLKMMFMD